MIIAAGEKKRSRCKASDSLILENKVLQCGGEAEMVKKKRIVRKDSHDSINCSGDENHMNEKKKDPSSLNQRHKNITSHRQSRSQSPTAIDSGEARSSAL